MSALKLSIIIINWNDWGRLERCLRSLRESTLPEHQILVVDNASSDGSVDQVRRLFPEVRVQANDINLGHTGGFNQGIQLVTGEHVLVLDSDTELEPSAIQLLIEHLDAHPDTALAAPRLFNTDGSIQETNRGFPNALTAIFGRQSLVTRLFPNNPISRRYLMRDMLDEMEPYRIKAASAAAMMFRRSLIGEVGAWDEDYPGYWVDIDWCMRLSDAGRHVDCVPRARIMHHESNQSGKKKSPRRIWIFNYGAYLLYRKHRTRGVLDPRAVFAFLALSVRAGLLIVANELRSDQPTRPTPTQSADAD